MNVDGKKENILKEKDKTGRKKVSHVVLVFNREEKKKQI